MGRESIVWLFVVTVNLMLLFVQIGVMEDRMELNQNLRSLETGNAVEFNESDDGDGCDKVRGGHRLYCVYMSQTERDHLAVLRRFEAWMESLLFPDRLPRRNWSEEL